MNSVRKFWNGEQGQDRVEYSLLMAFMALASAAIFLTTGGSVQGIWSAYNTHITGANSAV